MAKGSDTIAAEAARWVVRRDPGPLSDMDEAAFRRWLGSDPAHAVAFARASRTWDLADGFNKGAGPDISVDERSPCLSRRAMAAGIVATIGAAGAGGFWLAAGRRPERFATALGEQRNVTLADRSVLRLNTDSAVEVDYSRHWRTVTMVQGEALFDIAHDLARPFRVLVAGLEIMAIGTAFGIRMEGIGARVLVTRGLVRIVNGFDATAATYAPAGSEVLIGKSGVRITKLLPGELHRLLSWKDGILEFESQTVREIADEFNRYSASKIVVTDAAIGKLRFGGHFGLHEGRQFIDALCAGFPVRAIEGQDGNIYLAAWDAAQG